jgi:ABC-type transporter Mla MlaB component
MSDTIVIVLAAVALLLAFIEQAKAQGQSLTQYAIGALAVAILWLMLAP